MAGPDPTAPLVAFEGVQLRPIVTALWLATIVLGAIIAGLAALGYRRNGSRSMLALAAGIGLLTLVDPAVRMSLALSLSPAALGRTLQTWGQLPEIIGLCCILYAVVLARRTDRPAGSGDR